MEVKLELFFTSTFQVSSNEETSLREPRYKQEKPPLLPCKPRDARQHKSCHESTLAGVAAEDLTTMMYEPNSSHQ